MPLPPPPLFAEFLAASLALAISPGPGVAYIVSRTLAEGRRAGLASVAGIAAGNLGNALVAALCLVALLQLAPAATLVLKCAGAAYLAYLGIRALLRARTPAAGRAAPALRPARVFTDAFIVALTNPKTALFFAAFLPQFTHPPGNLPQILFLGPLFVAIALLTDTAYALAAGAIAPSLARHSQGYAAARYINAAVFLTLAALTALAPTQ